MQTKWLHATKSVSIIKWNKSEPISPKFKIKIIIYFLLVSRWPYVCVSARNDSLDESESTIDIENWNCRHWNASSRVLRTHTLAHIHSRAPLCLCTADGDVCKRAKYSTANERQQYRKTVYQWKFIVLTLKTQAENSWAAQKQRERERTEWRCERAHFYLWVDRHEQMSFEKCGEEANSNLNKTKHSSRS